jgi:hypothetical protein
MCIYRHIIVYKWAPFKSRLRAACEYRPSRAMVLCTRQCPDLLERSCRHAQANYALVGSLRPIFRAVGSDAVLDMLGDTDQALTEAESFT